jgi:uncharacterized repeat protein (TIGR01451 family)
MGGIKIMHENKILEKLLAIILIFTLTSANFAFVTKSFATSFAETLFGEKSDTGHKNVGFEAYFGTEDEKETSVISDVNNEELSMSMNIDVQNSGYLKDAKIEIAETEEGKGLNFELQDLEELPDYVQGFEDNVVYMQQINSSSEVSFELPITYKNEAYVNEDKFSNSALVKFSGIYVDDKGKETEVSRDIELTVSWKDDRNVKVETEATKYIDFGRGTILQTLVKVDTQTEENTLPIKESEITVEVPSLKDVAPSNITVVANNTMGTNGKSADVIDFSEDNWSYNSEENKLTIKVTNEKQLVRVDEFEDEYLKDADREIVEEERYYNVSGTDEYLITYTYENVNISDSVETINSNIEAKVVTFSGVEKDDNVNIITNSNNYEYTLDGKTGDIVSLNIENETEEVSKAYTYANYNESKYETEFTSKTIVNVSYKEIVKALNVEDTENLYTYKDGSTIVNNDLYYKQISVSKANFLYILGESGEIKVSDLEGNVIATINNESEVNEEGNIVVNFDEKYEKLSFEMTAPVGEGNLVISNVKAMEGSSVSKQNFANLSNITTKSIIRADYDYVESRVDVGIQTATINLVDTVTKATLKMDRDSLSTLAVNNDVEFRIELNNAVDTSDIYGHSVYEMDIPDYIESLDVTNINVLYGEGLDVTGAEVDGRTLRITLDGKQEGINSGVLTNGTNIVINANIKVNLYTPAKSETITLRYVNDEATNYDNNGTSNLEVEYSAPTGLVTVNSIANYNNVGSVTTSVRQGMQEDLIDIYSDAKVATMEVIVMNNNSNTVSDVSILGRIPFKGVKDIATGEDLGTTIDTKLVSTLVSDEHNNTSFEVYYSENGEATKDLSNEENGWTKNPETLDNVKSYLIVPVDENYEMQESEILRFTYEYEIPANLAHNEDIYGTFLAYYTNNSEVATTDETSTPDLVGLTTGEGPEVAIEVSSNKTEIKEYEELQVNVVAKNTGNDKAENINIEFPIPTYTEYVSYQTENENIEANVENNVLKVNASELESGKTIEFTVFLSVSKIPASIEEYYRGTEGFKYINGNYILEKTDENGNVSQEVITEVPEISIEPMATISAKDLGTTVKATAEKIKVSTAEFKITIENKSDLDEDLDVKKAGEEIIYDINVENLLETKMSNLVVTQVLPKELNLVKAVVVDYEDDGLTSKEVESSSYNEETRTVTWKIDELEGEQNIVVRLYVEVNELDEDITKSDIYLTSEVSADGTDTYESNSILTKLGKPVLTISQITDNTDTYIKEGDIIKYIFSVKNEGSADAEYVRLTDVIPEGITIRKISYITEGINATKKVSSNKEAVITANIPAGDELVVNIETVAANLIGVQEKSVTNYAVVTSPETPDATTNSITHIIEASEKSIVASELTSSTSSTSSDSSSNVTKTYKISGLAWEDADKDGARSAGETLLSGITVRLVNSDSGVIQKSTTTDASGNYTFSGVENGNYLVIFEFDTVKYTATAYRKDGVAGNVNSDAIMTKLEQDGKSRNGAVSDVITVANGSVSGIDIGLALADTFDLKLDKTISKITTQTVKGTDTVNYDNATIAKTEIASKYVYGSTVYIEYSITVSNVGDVAGYAKKIVDYMPEGMTFNSSLEANSNWYTGSDGNLYSTALSEIELVSGESKTIKLVLTRQLTEDNTDIVNNLAEIYEDYNIYGISDKNSTPANKAQGENDLGSADTVIGIKTGEILINISVIITTVLLGSIVIFIAYTKIVVRKKKGGV